MTASNPEALQILWLNGRFTPAAEAAISPFDRGFLHGDGVFETMRAENGVVLYLEEHLERLHASLSALRIDAGEFESLRETTRELLTRNGLSERSAVVKIVVSRGVISGMGTPRSSMPTVCITAQEYAPPSPAVYRRGWKLYLFREGYAPPLARHKSLNYLYFSLARQAALDAGFDEALIADPYGNITETAAGSLLLRTGGKWWTPGSPYQLPGVTLSRMTRLLGEAGATVEQRRASPADIRCSETVWVLNSLMGVMPVSHVMDSAVPDMASEEASRLRDALLGG